MCARIASVKDQAHIGAYCVFMLIVIRVSSDCELCIVPVYKLLVTYIHDINTTPVFPDGVGREHETLRSNCAEEMLFSVLLAVDMANLSAYLSSICSNYLKYTSLFPLISTSGESISLLFKLYT